MEQQKPEPQKQAAAPSVMDTAQLIKSIVQELRAPTEEELAVKARKDRDRRAILKQQNDMRRAQIKRQDDCPHVRKDGSSHVVAVHNFPDGVVRGICQQCQDIIMPGDPEYHQVILAAQENAVA